MQRRTADRRRRVLYSTHHADSAPSGDLERLREARRPVAVYGTRVRRRLRARWFSLVPVRRSTMMMVAGVIAAMTCLLIVCHYAAVAWPSVAYRPEIARPLRLDRPDSFGRWLMIAMLAGVAGVSFLIYQLRRHRNDDFAGHYRLWRTVLIVALLASLQALVSIIDWGGALLDLAFGQRVALSGSDWIRLVVLFGGTILALQVIAEIRRCRVAVAAMSVAVVCWAIMAAAKWNVLEISSVPRWVLVTSAPLLASSAVFVATVVYLRMLYREVRQIEDAVSWRERWQRLRQNLLDHDPDGEARAEAEGLPAKQPRRGWFRRGDEESRSKRQETKPRRSTSRATNEPDEERDESDPQPDDHETTSTSATKRRWFSWRKSKTNDRGKDASSDSDTSTQNEPPSKPQKKRRRFSLRLAPPSLQEATSTSDEDESEAAESEQPQQQRRGWFRRKSAAEPDQERDDSDENSVEQSAPRSRSWFRRNKSADQESIDDEEGVTQAPSRSQTSGSVAEEAIDPEEIDWNALSKSERRRLRKQLKRQNRAA